MASGEVAFANACKAPAASSAEFDIVLLALLQSSAPSKLKWCPARLESKSLLLAMTIADALRKVAMPGVVAALIGWRDSCSRKSHDCFGRDFCAFCQVGRRTGVKVIAHAAPSVGSERLPSVIMTLR